MSDIDTSGCGCCEGIIGVTTPARIDNRPGLPTIPYRVGVYRQFRETMQTRLAANVLFPGLDRLKTRREDDFSMALLDAWAVVADVLTFYQERVANESYKRTATERVSLLELAHMVRYSLQPGVAANTYLAFTGEDAPGSPPQTMVDIGTKVQSLPNPGEQPQIFETIEAIEVRSAWNAMKPVSTQPARVFKDGRPLWLQGTNTGLKAGDVLVIVDEGGDKPETQFLRVESVDADAAQQQTLVSFEGYQPPPPPVQPTAPAIRITDGFKQKLSLDNKTVQDLLLNRRVPQSDLEALAIVQGWSVQDVLANMAAQTGKAPVATLASQAGQQNGSKASQLEDVATKVTAPLNQAFQKPRIFALRMRASLFGHNAADWRLMPPVIQSNYIAAYDAQVGNTANRSDPTGSAADVNDWPVVPPPSKRLDLDSVYTQILRNSWLAVEQPDAPPVVTKVTTVTETAATNYGLSAKITRLEVDTDVIVQKLDSNGVAQPFTLQQLRQMTVYGQSEELFVADAPVNTPIQQSPLRVYGTYEGLRGRRTIIVSGERQDKAGEASSEIAVLVDVATDGNTTLLSLEKDLAYPYKPETVTINANVALATQGESIEDEILGSGDASQTYQSFTLRQSPLTYVQSPTQVTGIASTLKVEVNGIPWQEVSSLYDYGPRDHVYVTRIQDDGKVTVQFGDGHNGARLPTGEDNVRASYRKGSGQQALVDPGQLNILLTRPMGVKGVSNPFAPTGAADPETTDDARRNADNTVRTLGRIVSKQDYEDYARSYASVAKALATVIWTNQLREVFVTVAGPATPDNPQGTEIVQDSPLYTRIYSDMRRHSNPTVALTLQSYRTALFRVAAYVKVNPNNDPAGVLKDVEKALRAAFSFDARSFGQPVTLKEILAIIQGRYGVVTTRVEALYRVDNPPSDPKKPLDTDLTLPSALPQWQKDGAVSLAELLLLHPTQPFDALEVMS